MSNIILIGMPGCGKSTIGYLLSKNLKMELIDTDKYIESKNKVLIQDLFKKGEELFRDKETEVLIEVCKNKNIIISTGGGIIKRKVNIDTMKKAGSIIFIDRDVESIFSDVDTDSRPLLKDNKNHLYNLYNDRYELYKKAADYIVKNDKELHLVIREIENYIRVR